MITVEQTPKNEGTILLLCYNMGGFCDIISHFPFLVFHRFQVASSFLFHEHTHTSSFVKVS